MDGKVGNRNIELFIFVTPKSKKIYKFTLYFEEQTSWSSLKGDYDKYYEIFKEENKKIIKKCNLQTQCSQGCFTNSNVNI